MDRLTAISVFVNVADRGSLTAAANNLGMSRTMASRHLQELETWLGARLFHRSTRRITLTEAGAGIVVRFRKMLDLAEEARSSFAESPEAPRGLLRISCPVSFAQVHLTTAVTDYVVRYPGTVVDILAVDHTVNMVEDRVDLAIRIANSLDPNLFARKLGVCRSVVCASPEYLQRHRTPAQPEDLSLHNCLTYSHFGNNLWRFMRDGQPLDIPVNGNINANEVSVVAAAALLDAGIALLPHYSVDALVKEGRLVALLPDYPPEGMDVHAVYTSRRQMPATTRTMLDFLVERFESSPLL